MTIKLPADIEARLAMQLAEGLQGTTLTHDFITAQALQWVDPINEGLPDDVRLKLDRFCGEPGLKTFINHELRADLATQNANSIPKRALTDFPEFRNTIAYSRKLVDKLKTLPLRFRLTVALPPYLSDPIIAETPDKIPLGNEIEIVNGAQLPDPFPMNSSIARIDDNLFKDFIFGTTQGRGIYLDRLYLTMPLLGYATHNAAGSISRLFEDYIKAFYGAGLAEGMLDLDWNFEEKERLPYITVHSENDKRPLLATEKLEQELLDADDRLSTLAFAERNKSDIWLSTQTSLSKIASIFGTEKDSRKLFTACIWYYRAKLNKRPLDKLLEATIAIEVLLGDRLASEGVGLANLLGNRCAFLLGKSSLQRGNILQLFSKIYSLRSNIVHEGRHKLEPGEGRTVNAAVALCGTIISREMDIRSPSRE